MKLVWGVQFLDMFLDMVDSIGSMIVWIRPLREWSNLFPSWWDLVFNWRDNQLTQFQWLYWDFQGDIRPKECIILQGFMSTNWDNLCWPLGTWKGPRVYHSRRSPHILASQSGKFSLMVWFYLFQHLAIKLKSFYYMTILYGNILEGHDFPFPIINCSHSTTLEYTSATSKA